MGRSFLPQDKANKRQASPVPWLVGLAGLVGLVLGIGGFLYLRGVFRAEADYAIANVPAFDEPGFDLTLVGLTSSIATSGHMIGFWREVDAVYAARQAAIDGAERLIQYETYFMTPGRRADDFAEALARRAQVGVRVQLLLDHHGTEAMPDDYWQRLRDLGIELQFFRKPNWRRPLEYNSRSHRKLLIIDGKQALIGGAGTSDYWDGTEFDHDTAPWLEFEVAYEGEVVNLLQGKFLQNWAYSGGQLNLSDEIRLVQSDAPVDLYITDDTSSLNESSIRLLMQLSMLTAQERLWIGSPYFVPDANTTRALLTAHGNGVDVRVLTMSAATDKRMVHRASRELYGDLLEAGIAICEYQPSMMHAKLVLVDDAWVSTGSANFDPRSYFHNDELNISGSYPELAQEIEQFFTDALADSNCLTYEDWQNRPWLETVKGRAALLFKNLL
ncbi:phosphatidylserine/phosphatidylglycerophosphate/cardiolipin synthase family protein [Nodosilinea sp. E11]|uniref:phospholipase D-like domain-containing protein n=1 Tax=Nodosilinea sp. E11 TaxID=3037479 RepID=UPI00293489FF|nr:phosphatidylserine/phosphatidylglycerophosphate/cardiolipin synthase family protein [Nodosilinea sp. E11]WOD40680.1 phosphatidylserine/phosphatidylglycerophosphate/cardiolipin synthase family protein [Nodosilinea sp. E11]